MALYPKIQSPCPYKGRLSDILDGDICRLCKREVFDLDAMSAGARAAFLQDCNNGDACVTYRLRPALAAAAFAVALVAPTMAMACGGADDEVLVITGGRGPAPVALHAQPVEVLTDRDVHLIAPESPAPKPSPTPSDPPPAGTRPVVP